MGKGESGAEGSRTLVLLNAMRRLGCTDDARRCATQPCAESGSRECAGGRWRTVADGPYRTLPAHSPLSIRSLPARSLTFRTRHYVRVIGTREPDDEGATLHEAVAAVEKRLIEREPAAPAATDPRPRASSRSVGRSCTSRSRNTGSSLRQPGRVLVLLTTQGRMERSESGRVSRGGAHATSATRRTRSCRPGRT